MASRRWTVTVAEDFSRAEASSLPGAPLGRFRAAMLVILGQARDPQVQAVTERLAHNSVPFRVVDYYDYSEISIDFPDSGGCTIHIGSEQIPRNIVVWDRSKFFLNTAYYFDDRVERETDDEMQRRHQLQVVEWKALYQLLITLPGVQYVSDPLFRNALLKPNQQIIAHNVGLNIPGSLISNKKRDIETFASENSDIILKSLSGGRFARRDAPSARTDMLMTMPVSAQQIEKAEPVTFRRAPHFFQQAIPKAYEVRLFAYEGRCHAFRVDSQVAKTTSTDWRHGAAFLDWAPIETPEFIDKAAQKFLKYCKLFYGSFDFVVTPSGDWVFLECNRDGQWIWLDRLVGGALSDGLADAMTETWFIN